MDICTTIFNITLGFTLIFTLLSLFLFIMDLICPNPAWSLGDLETITPYLPTIETEQREDAPHIYPIPALSEMNPIQENAEPPQVNPITNELLLAFPNLL